MLSGFLVTCRPLLVVLETRSPWNQLARVLQLLLQVVIKLLGLSFSLTELVSVLQRWWGTFSLTAHRNCRRLSRLWPERSPHRKKEEKERQCITPQACMHTNINSLMLRNRDVRSDVTSPPVAEPGRSLMSGCCLTCWIEELFVLLVTRFPSTFYISALIHVRNNQSVSQAVKDTNPTSVRQIWKRISLSS